MLINLTDVFTTEGKETAYNVPLLMEIFHSDMGDFKIIEKEPVSFHFTNVGKGKIRMTGKMKVIFKTCCDRCLTEVPTHIELEFDRMLYSPEGIFLKEEYPLEEEPAEESFMEGGQFHPETFAYHELLLNWPMKILCKPECRGTCPVCGQNRNEGECGCDTFVPDPRMAKIKDIFNTDKEV